MTYETGFPAFAIFNSYSSTIDGKYYTDQEVYKFSFGLISTGEQIHSIDAIPCKEAIDKYVDDESVKAGILNNFGSSIEYFLCPDTESYQIYLSTW